MTIKYSIDYYHTLPDHIGVCNNKYKSLIFMIITFLNTYNYYYIKSMKSITIYKYENNIRTDITDNETLLKIYTISKILYKIRCILFDLKLTTTTISHVYNSKYIIIFSNMVPYSELSCINKFDISNKIKYYNSRIMLVSDKTTLAKIKLSEQAEIEKILDIESIKNEEKLQFNIG